MEKRAMWILSVVILVVCFGFFLKGKYSESNSQNETMLNETILTGKAILDSENNSNGSFSGKQNYCGKNYCDNWKASYCNGKVVWKNKTCYNIGYSDGRCYNNSYEQGWLVEECMYSCFKGKCTIGGGSSGVGIPPPSQKTENPENETIANTEYFLHENTTVTIFWVGEEAGEENGFISNEQSAWDDSWMEHYGGLDEPDNRNGSFPLNFTPLENPFYFALPYNDFENGVRKENAKSIVYWAGEKEWQTLESMCKNQWIKIIKGNKTAYAQWEDAGPFGENDSEYVFNESLPQNLENRNAGLDVSPAVRDFLNLSGMDKVSWRFVNFSEVPEGPWKEIITTSQISWG